MKIGLEAICGESPRVLILGSLPGDASIKKQQYYGHPQNHFWQILSILLKKEVPLLYDERVRFLKENKIALWDVMYSAQRQGSLDSKIKSPIFNDLRTLIAANQSLELIILNGRKAQQCYEKYFSDISLAHCTVRSSSPVASQACNSAAEKAAQWHSEISKYIQL